MYRPLFLAVALVGLVQSSILADENVLLRHKLQKGEVLQSEVTHLAKTNTRKSKVDQSSQCRTVSQKIWEVTGVDDKGNMTFVYRIDSVSMSQQVGDSEEIRYNSDKDTEVPSIYNKVAETIGKPISNVTIDPRGQVVDRDESGLQTNLGMGDIAVVFPEKAIAIGSSWDVTREIRVRDSEGASKAIKIQEKYTLEKVSAGVATILIESTPLTPLREPEIEAQVLQQLSHGKLRFDIDAGRVLSKELQWDETVVDFSGPGSQMEYSARLSENLQTKAVEKSARAKPSTKRQ